VNCARFPGAEKDAGLQVLLALTGMGLHLLENLSRFTTRLFGKSVCAICAPVSRNQPSLARLHLHRSEGRCPAP
jgi:hypothetical protein